MIGVVRKIDQFGRIVIPMEWRRIFDINEGDDIEIIADGNELRVRKYKTTKHCTFCDSGKILTRIGEYAICESCAKEVVRRYGESTEAMRSV